MRENISGWVYEGEYFWLDVLDCVGVGICGKQRAWTHCM